MAIKDLIKKIVTRETNKLDIYFYKNSLNQDYNESLFYLYNFILLDSTRELKLKYVKNNLLEIVSPYSNDFNIIIKVNDYRLIYSSSFTEKDTSLRNFDFCRDCERMFEYASGYKKNIWSRISLLATCIHVFSAYSAYKLTEFREYEVNLSAYLYDNNLNLLSSIENITTKYMIVHGYLSHEKYCPIVVKYIRERKDPLTFMNEQLSYTFYEDYDVRKHFLLHIAYSKDRRIYGVVTVPIRYLLNIILELFKQPIIEYVNLLHFNINTIYLYLGLYTSLGNYRDSYYIQIPRKTIEEQDIYNLYKKLQEIQL